MALSQVAASSLINWIEKGVTKEHHLEIKNRFNKEISLYLQTNINNVEEIHICLMRQITLLVNGEVSKEESLKSINRNKDIIVSTLNNKANFFIEEEGMTDIFLQLLTLIKKKHSTEVKISEKSQALLKKNIEKLQESSSWKGSPLEIESAQKISRLTFISLNTGVLEKEYIELVIKKMIDSLSSDEWFSPSCTIYGKSFLLRSLISLCANENRHSFYNYLKNVCEHLLKRMEIKRERIIISNNSNNHYSKNLVEQLRFNLALLESGVFFNDLRFLNAVMKSNDRIYSKILKIKISNKITHNNISNISTAIHYNQVINLQEEWYGSLE